MAAGLFGYMGYDMVRLMERLPDKNPIRSAFPDAVLLRPTVVAIFDNVEDRVTVVTPVWPNEGRSARRLRCACEAARRCRSRFRPLAAAEARSDGEPLSARARAPT